MSSRRAKSPLNYLSISEIRSIAKLAVDATGGLTDIVEGVHQSVGVSVGFSGNRRRGRTRGLTGLVYRSIRGVSFLVGHLVDSVLGWFQTRTGVGRTRTESPGRDAVLAALNGVMGDRLLVNSNPLATHMSIRFQGEALSEKVRPFSSEVSGKVLLMIHGLCMNDLQWTTTDGEKVVNHGEVLASEFGYSPAYLRYNSGRHISQNGRELADQLEHLISIWPKPIEELTVIGHSMGGLLIRSAAYYAELRHFRWPELLKRIIFLGTPHHGAPLERAGNWVDAILERAPYTSSFARLGKLRSAGITDLRFGNVLDEDWQYRERFERAPDSRTPLPLPEGVACYAIAATTASKRGILGDRLTGDGLVPVRSALGEDKDPLRTLQFSEDKKWVTYRTNHLALLSSSEVTEQLRTWLTHI